MKNYIFLLLILFLTSCKTTPEEYSAYPFVSEINSDEYEVITLMSEKNELKTIYGYTIPAPNKMIDSLNSTKKIRAMPLILYNSDNVIYFLSYDKKNFSTHIMEYNMTKNKLNLLAKEDNIQKITQFFEEKEEKEKLINFNFIEAEKYFKLKIELKDTLSDKDRRWALEKYPNNEIKRKEVEKLLTYTYKACFINLQMPKEEIRFKYNLSPNGKVLFFGNEELYKKGYLGIYIYKSSNVVSHSGGLYLIRPKEKK